MTSTENNEESIDESRRQLAIDINIQAEIRDTTGFRGFIASSSSPTLMIYEYPILINGYSAGHQHFQNRVFAGSV
jgi:hypothetical protein